MLRFYSNLLFFFKGCGEWNPHRVEMALWTHFVVTELKKELLEGMPDSSATPSATATQPTENGGTESTEQSNENVSFMKICFS